MCNIFSLYYFRQEGVSEKIYQPLNISVETPSGEIIQCRVYQLVEAPPKLSENAKIPYERLPSSTYLQTIIQGAIESNLPNEYISYLESMKHNGNVASEDFANELDLLN